MNKPQIVMVVGYEDAHSIAIKEARIAINHLADVREMVDPIRQEITLTGTTSGTFDVCALKRAVRDSEEQMQRDRNSAQVGREWWRKPKRHRHR